MAKQIKSKRKPEIIGKGQVTPLQIAFVVDRYLLDNNYIEARSRFRNECSLMLGSPVDYAPPNLMSLEHIMEEFISLKGQKKMLDEESAFLANERSRIINLIQGMQAVMNNYNLSTPAPPRPPIVHSSSFRANPMTNASTIGSPADCCVSNAPVITNPVSMPIIAETPLTAPTPRLANKRKGSKVTNMAAKKPCSPLQPMEPPNQAMIQSNNKGQRIFEECYIPKTSSPYSSAPQVSMHHGSSVAKTLFSQSHHAVSSSPETPPQPISSETDEYKSPNAAQNNALNNVSSLEKITNLSSMRESIVCNSSPEKINTPRRIIKERLDFDSCVDVSLAMENPVGTGNSTSEPEEFDAYDIDFDALAADIDFSDLFVDLNNSDKGIELPQNPSDDVFETFLEGILSEKDMNIEAENEVMGSRKGAEKPIQTSYPARNLRSSAMDKENECS